MTNRWGNNDNSDRFPRSIITADGDGSHEIKRCLPSPWKKSYNQPKKWRHYFAKKDPYSQSIVFPVVMYGCETWTIKKAEHQKMNCGVGEDS